MNNIDDLNLAVEKINDFAEFFLNLGDLRGPDMLLAIGTKHPEFADYMETVKEPPETASDFFRIYAGWVISRICKECSVDEREISPACAGSERYRIIGLQQKGMPLWELFESVMGK